jgi:ATP-binding cassette, subfamily B, bacterial
MKRRREREYPYARRLVRGIVRRHWLALGGGGLGAALITLAELAAPFPLKWVLDELIHNRTGEFTFDRSEIRLLFIVAQAVIAIALVGALGAYVGEVWLKRAGERIAHDLRVRTYAHLQRLSLGYHDKRNKGDLVTRLTEDANAVGDLFSDAIGSMAQACLLLAGIATISLFLDPWVALVLLLVTPVLALVTAYFRKRVRSAARAQRAHEGQIASLAAESLSAIRVVKSMGGENYEHDRVAESSEKRRRHGVRVAGLEARFSATVDIIGAVTMAIVLVVGAFRVSAGALTAGSLVVFAQYSRRLYRPLKDIARYSTKAARAMARAERIAEVLSADDMLQDRPGAYVGERAEGRLAFEHVEFAYDGDRGGLHDVTLTIPAGQRVAIVGPSGAGKSTLGALVARFYDPASGWVLLDGRDLRHCSLDWLREQVGLLLQDTVLFTGTIAENIAYGRTATRDEVAAAARMAGAEGFIHALPNGYDEPLGPQGVGLSGGQRQRLGIARLILRNPPLLVLDEPTTGLDAVSEAQVIDGLGDLMAGRTTLLVTHSIALARKCDRIIVISDGRIVQDGSPSALTNVEGLFRDMSGATLSV